MRKRLTATIFTLLAVASFWMLFAFTSSQDQAAPVIREGKPAPNLEEIRNPGQFQLDHFKVYNIEPMPVNADVWLRGQFDGNLFKRAFVYEYAKFLNPVDKNGEGIIDKYDHLNWHWIETDPEPTREVTLYNQFGQQIIKIDRAVALLAPAEKIEPGSQPPSDLDHYKVYEVVSAQPVHWGVDLKDQFGHEGNRAIIARYFAVPVDKRHNNLYFPIINKEDHIVFYMLDPIPINEYRPTRDQFGQHDMRTIESELLGVPTKKISWQ